MAPSALLMASCLNSATLCSEVLAFIGTVTMSFLLWPTAAR